MIREGKKSKEKVDVFSFELLAYREMVNSSAMPYSENPKEQLPDYFITADSISSKGHVGYLVADFTRESSSAFEAIKTAIKGIIQAIPHAKLIKAGPYIANLSEMAQLFGCTKQNLSKYARGESANSKTFPCSIISGKVDYWYVLDVALWFYKQNKLNIQKFNVEVLKAVYDLNIAIEEIKNEYDHNNDFLSLAKQVAA